MSVESVSLERRLSELRALVDSGLRRWTAFDAGCPVPLGSAIRYSLLAPGKRLRPVLLLLAAEACGGSVEEALPGACAVEMVHAYSLIHDDLPAMDDDDLRRGLPACHKKFGEGVAILAGDALLALAFEVLAKGVRPPETAAACCAALAEAAGACHLVGGQADDLAGGGSRGLDLLESIHHRKTGAMIVVSLRMGAMIARADRTATVALERYGRALGLTFQITDDLLDIRGVQEEVGKRVGKDRDHGKLTFPAVLGIERSASRAAELTEEACAALGPLGGRGSCLEALARCVLERNR